MATEIEDHQENKELKSKKKKKKQSLGVEEKVEETHDVPELKNGDAESAENGSGIQSPTDGKKKKKKKKKNLTSAEAEASDAQTEDAQQDAEVKEEEDVNEGEAKKKKKKKGKKKESMSTESESLEEETGGALEDDLDSSVLDKTDEEEDSESEHEEKPVNKGKKRPAEDSYAVYIGNMSFNTNEDQLSEFFTSNGHKPVSTVIISWQSGHSSGFGIVNFATKEEAENAIELDGGTLDGRNVRVNVYSGKLQRTSGGFQKGRSPGFTGGQDGEETDTLFVAGLSYNTTEDDLYEAFQGCESVDIFKDRETGNSKGLGKIKFASVDEAKTALSEMNNEELDGRTIKLRFFSPQARGGRGGRGGGFRGGRGGDRGRGFGRGRGRGRGGGASFKGSGQKIKFDD